ncbi:MAG: hypothetical protein NWQ19_06270 [Nonlabens sp.]|nr:hypothetical protein [Nonlabens sp.]
MKTVISIICLLMLTSCVTTNYYKTNDQTIGVDFNQGSWVLLEIQTSNGQFSDLNEKVLADFKKLLGNRLVYAPTSKDYAFQKSLDLQPTHDKLENWSYGMKANTAINVHFQILRNDLKGASTSKHRTNANDSRNEVLASIEIYDLETNTIIYQQGVKGLSSDEGQTEDFLLTDSLEKMLTTAYEKALKELKKKSFVK